MAMTSQQKAKAIEGMKRKVDALEDAYKKHGARQAASKKQGESELRAAKTDKEKASIKQRLDNDYKLWLKNHNKMYAEWNAAMDSLEKLQGSVYQGR